MVEKEIWFMNGKNVIFISFLDIYSSVHITYFIYKYFFFGIYWNWQNNESVWVWWWQTLFFSSRIIDRIIADFYVRISRILLFTHNLIVINSNFIFVFYSTPIHPKTKNSLPEIVNILVAPQCIEKCRKS